MKEKEIGKRYMKLSSCQIRPLEIQYPILSSQSYEIHLEVDQVEESWAVYDMNAVEKLAVYVPHAVNSYTIFLTATLHSSCRNKISLLTSRNTEYEER